MDNQKQVIVDVLRMLGLNILASDASTQNNWDILDGYVKIIEHKANKIGRFDLLEILCFAGLIYC